MKINCFYQIEFPVKIAKILMKEAGDNGNPKDLVVRVPVPDFSHESYDDVLYRKGCLSTFFNLLVDGLITKEEFKAIRIFEVTEINGKQNKTLCKTQCFRDCKTNA